MLQGQQKQLKILLYPVTQIHPHVVVNPVLVEPVLPRTLHGRRIVVVVIRLYWAVVLADKMVIKAPEQRILLVGHRLFVGVLLPVLQSQHAVAALLLVRLEARRHLVIVVVAVRIRLRLRRRGLSSWNVFVDLGLRL